MKKTSINFLKWKIEWKYRVTFVKNAYFQIYITVFVVCKQGYYVVEEDGLMAVSMKGVVFLFSKVVVLSDLHGL